MPSCSTSRSVQKYKSSSSLTLQDVTDNGSKTSNKIELENVTRTIESSSNIFVSSGHFFIGDGGLLSNVQMGGSAVGTLQTVTDNGTGSTHKINLTNIATSLETIGNIVAGTNVYASEFYGDGTTLTGVALSVDLVSNVTRIGNLESNLAANVTRIGNLESNLAANVIRIGTLETDLTSNASRIGTLEGETQPVNRGGTGLGGCSTGDIIYGSSTNIISILSNSAATGGQFLRLNANKTAPEWATVSGGTGSSPWTTSVNDVYWNGGGNVGINLTNPQYTLDVKGDINMSTGSSFRINGVTQTFGGGTGSSPWTTSVNDIYWNGGGNVGISNTNPQHELSVSGNTHSTYFHGDGSNVTNITLTKESTRNVEIAEIKVLGANWQRN